jgi:hypothetical protein
MSDSFGQAAFLKMEDGKSKQPTTQIHLLLTIGTSQVGRCSSCQRFPNVTDSWNKKEVNWILTNEICFKPRKTGIYGKRSRIRRMKIGFFACNHFIQPEDREQAMREQITIHNYVVRALDPAT